MAIYRPSLYPSLYKSSKNIQSAYRISKVNETPTNGRFENKI